jgi:hypothetical protein
MSKKYFFVLIIVFLGTFTLSSSGCDGLFSTNPKKNIPTDHTNSISGALHKGNNRQDMTPDECGDCHTTDLRGKVTLINGVYTWANSCYQCHGALWERNGGGNKKLF